MADKIKFLAGMLADLASQPKKKGQVYFAIDGDKGKIAFDVDNDTRIYMTEKPDSASHADLADKASTAEKDTSGNTIAKYIKSIQLLSSDNTKFNYTLGDGSVIPSKTDGIRLNFVSRAGDTMSGKLTANGGILVNTASGTNNFIISRNSGVTESTSFGQDDGGLIVTTVNDEATTSIKFVLQATDTETGGGAAANEGTITFGLANGKTSIIADSFIGTASKAIQDSKGQNIADTYIKGIALVNSATAPYYQLTLGSGKSDETTRVSLPVASTTSAGVITNAAQTLSGEKTLDANGSLIITKASGFNYTGIETGTAGVPRAIWFSHSAKVGTPVYDVKFTYDPNSTTAWTNYDSDTPASHGVIYADRFAGTAQYSAKDTEGNLIVSTYVKGITLNNHATQPFYKLTNALGGTLADVNLPVASTTYAGVVTNAAQTFAGLKTFNNSIYVNGKVSIENKENTVEIGSDNGSYFHFLVRKQAVNPLTFWFGGPIQTNGNITPYGGDTYTLGTSYNRWKGGYFGSEGLSVSGSILDRDSNELRAKLFVSTFYVHTSSGTSFIIGGKNSAAGPITNVTIPNASKDVAGLITNAAQTIQGQKTLLAVDATSNSLQTGTFIISSSAGETIGLEFWRGTSASWQITNNSGNLIFKTNWNDGIQTTYNVTSLQLNHTTGAGQIPYLGINGSNTGYRLYVNGVSYFNGNITYNSGTKNMMVWLDGSKIMKASNHYVNASKLAINYTSEPGYNFYVEGTSYFNDTVFLPDSKSIIQNQKATSNYTTAIVWYKGGEKTLTHAPSIGHHNTGNTTGAMILLPYETDTAPWKGEVGLYIAQGFMKLDGKEVFTANSYTTLDNRYVNVSGDTMTGSLTATSFTASTENAFNSSGVMRIKSASTMYLNRGSATSLIFQLNGTNHARFDTAGHFIPEADNTYNIGIASTQRWKNVYAVTFHGALSGNATSADKVNKSLSVNGKSFNGSATVDVGTIGTAYGGTGVTTHTQNRIVWSTSGTTLQAGGSHYINSTKVAINSTSEPSYNFYVGGTSYFNGVVKLKGDMYADSFSGGVLNLSNSNIDNVNGIYFCDAVDGGGEGLNFWRSTTAVDSFYAVGGKLKFAPNRTFGGLGTVYYVPYTSSTDGNVGSGTVPVYSSEGVLTASTSTVGSTTKPVYMSNGAITASTGTVGNNTHPMYLNGGTMTACSYYLQANIKSYSGSLATGGWKTLNGTGSSPTIAIAYNNAAATWNSATYSASLVWGCQDTRGLLDCAHGTPTFTIGGASYGGDSDDAPAWYMKFSGTNGTTYNLNSMPYAQNSDKLDGYHGSSSQAANTYVLRDGSGYIYTNYINSNTSNGENPTVSQFIVTNGSDNYYRKASFAHVKKTLTTGMLGMNENYLIKPKADFRTTSSSYTGAITVVLPASIGNTMVSMWIDVYLYATNASFSVHCGGYTYNNSTWANSPFAMVYGADYTVRLGHNGTNFVIYIGETTTKWSYPQISVRDVIIGYSPSYTNWANDWSINFSTTLSNVTSTHTQKAITSKNIASQSVNYANYSGYATYLSNNTKMSYGWNGLNYFNASMSEGSAAGVNDSPTADWYHVIRMNHSNGNGYYFDIASCFHSNNMYMKRVASGSSSGWKHIWVEGNSVTSAVWNDYAECRKATITEAGYVLYEIGDDSLDKTYRRLQPFAGVSSDTWGFSQGQTDEAKTPIAVAGRVLVYPYQNRNNYQPGDCVCAAPGGTVDIMTREEVIEYPDRIVGTVSCIPDYETWGGGEGADREPVKVNGRIWIKVR